MNMEAVGMWSGLREADGSAERGGDDQVCGDEVVNGGLEERRGRGFCRGFGSPCFWPSKGAAL